MIIALIQTTEVILDYIKYTGRTACIYGVATAAARRRRGLSTRLMTAAMRRIGESGDEIGS